MIPAYSPQARGRSERSFGTWQGRLPQELRLAGIDTVEAANQFLREHYVAEFNRRFQVPPAQRGSAFVACRHKDLDLVFALAVRAHGEPRQHRQLSESQPADRAGEAGEEPWPAAMSRCTSTWMPTLSITHGPHQLGRFTAQGIPVPRTQTAREGAVEKTAAAPPWKTLRVSHFPPASAAAGD